jgi:3-hydroxybutyryl-CoA dehydratase
MYYEELNIGKKITTRQRVVTPTDIDIFAIMTGAINPLFLEDGFGRNLGFQGRIAPGLLTLALATGLQYATGVFDHLIAFLGIDKLKFLAAVSPSDTIWCEAEVIESKDVRADRGVVKFKWIVKNQEERPVLEAETTFMLRKRQSLI